MLTAQRMESCPLQLSEDQVEQFRADGFLAFADVLSVSEVESAKSALSGMVESLRASHRTMKNGSGEVWAAPDSTMKIQFQHGFATDGASEAQLHEGVRKFHDFVGIEPFLTEMARSHPRISGVLAGLIGEAPILSQDMALVNPPRIGTGKPWHQDDAYFKIAPLDAVCGVWIALDEAGVENGCMHFRPGAHREGALRHFHGSDCEIVAHHAEILESEAVPVPLPAGGAVFFSGTAPHMTRPNASDLRRRALQFHYRSRDSRLVNDAEYDAIFVESDGTPASCAAAARRGF